MLLTKYTPVAFGLFGFTAAKPAPSISFEVALQTDKSQNLGPLGQPTAFEISHQLVLIGDKATDVTQDGLFFVEVQLPDLPEYIVNDVQTQLEAVEVAIDKVKKYAWQDNDYFWDTHLQYTNAVRMEAKTIEVIASGIGELGSAGDVSHELFKLENSLKSLEDLLVDLMPECHGGRREKCKDEGRANGNYMLFYLQNARKALDENTESDGGRQLEI